MNLSRQSLLAGLCLALFSLPLHALKTDRQQPLDVKADSTDGTLGDGMTTLRGHVEINQGTLMVRADVADVAKSEGRVTRIVLTGDPVHLQQEIENEGLVTAEASQIEYEVATGIVTLTGAADVVHPQYQISGEKPVYCLEGSIAVAGALVQWLRDNLGLIDSAPEVEVLARTVDDNGGAYIVPAFSGLFAPYWRSDARGVIAGLTRYVNKGHIARAVLEANAYQTLDIMAAMQKDSGVELNSLKVDGGMVANELLMQFQADLLNVPVIRPSITETTALGAAYAAGMAVGFWSGAEELRKNWAVDKTWQPAMDSGTREKYYQQWKKAVDRTFDWVN